MSDKPRTITDDQLQQALDWLREAASKAAKARAERLYLEEHLGHIRSKIALECMEAGHSAAKADVTARASDAYKTALDGYKVAVEADELYRWRRAASDAILSAWQTMNANDRAMGKLQ